METKEKAPHSMKEYRFNQFKELYHITDRKVLIEKLKITERTYQRYQKEFLNIK